MDYMEELEKELKEQGLEVVISVESELLSDKVYISTEPELKGPLMKIDYGNEI